MRPSARNSTPSACEAASGSCVTITIVRPVAIGALTHQVEDLGSRARVEGAGGLVREQHVGPGDQGAGDGHPLLLSAGQLRGPVTETLGEADPGRHLRQPRRSARRPERRAGSSMFWATVSAGIRL